MTSIDFEEGEVEDLSGSDHEDSGHEYTDYDPTKVSLYKSSKRKRHTQRNADRSRCSRRESTVLLGLRAVELPHVDGRNANSKRSKERSKLPLLEFLSEDEDDTYLMSHEEPVSPVTSDMIHVKG